MKTTRPIKVELFHLDAGQWSTAELRAGTVISSKDLEVALALLKGERRDDEVITLTVRGSSTLGWGRATATAKVWRSAGLD